MKILFEFLGMPVTYLTLIYVGFLYFISQSFVRGKLIEAGISEKRVDDVQQWLIYIFLMIGKFIGILPIAYYSTMYMLGLLVVIQISKMNAEKFNLKEEDIEFYAYSILFAGLIGARVYYIIFKWDYFKNNIIETIDIWNGIKGLAIHGGVIGAAIGIVVITYIKKINFWDLADLAALPFLLAQAIGRVGNLINGEAHGVPTFTPIKVLLSGTFSKWYSNFQMNPFENYYPELVPWGIVFGSDTAAGQEFPNIPTHPTMIYEMILNILGFCILYFYFRNKKMKRGSIAAIYTIIYAINRTIVSIFRADDLYFMGFKMPFIANMFFAIFGLTVLYLVNYKKKIEKKDN